MRRPQWPAWLLNRAWNRQATPYIDPHDGHVPCAHCGGCLTCRLHFELFSAVIPETGTAADAGSHDGR